MNLMFWSTTNFKRLVELHLPYGSRKSKTITFLKSIISSLQIVADETLYKMQHNGTTIYIEKMLNEYYNITGYDPMRHNETKLIYIEDIAKEKRIYIYQDNEDEDDVYLEDDDSENDTFIDSDSEGIIQISWTIYIPAYIQYDEISLRAKVDEYRYYGKKYNIITY